MKAFETINFNYEDCRKEVLELRDFLGAHTSLKERSQILPVFKKRKHLSSFLGVYNSHGRFDRFAHELDLFGDFACDLAAGDWKNKKFVLVEFENAESGSVFVKKKSKNTLEWSQRLEHGFSQLIDWFYKIDSHRNLPEFEKLFGARSVTMSGLLIVGRRQNLEALERDRLGWRERKVLIAGHQVHCMTFDDLCEDMLDRLSTFPPLEKLMTAQLSLTVESGLTVEGEATQAVPPSSPSPPPTA